MTPQGSATTSQHSPDKHQQLPISAGHKPHKKEPEIVTITAENCSQATPSASRTGASPRHTADTPCFASKKNLVHHGQDKLLKKLPGKNKAGTTILWLPGSGRHVSEGGPDAYRPFTHIVRTLHLEDAVTVCSRWRIEPKNVITFSSIDSRQLPQSHPCATLKVLWFSAMFDDEGLDDASDWYGNVQFAVDARVLVEQWKYSFLVEMMTTPTHTTSRILLTNTDYSDSLTPYDRNRAGGPWQVTPDGRQKALINCSRYRFKGFNQHEHILEFMLDVKYEDEMQLLNNCKISFKNHEDAQDMEVRHVCNRYQRAGTKCPTPYTRDLTAHLFFEGLQHLHVFYNSVVPRLSIIAQQYWHEYLKRRMELLAHNFSLMVPKVQYA